MRHVAFLPIDVYIGNNHDNDIVNDEHDGKSIRSFELFVWVFSMGIVVSYCQKGTDEQLHVSLKEESDLIVEEHQF